MPAVQTVNRLASNLDLGLCLGSRKICCNSAHMATCVISERFAGPAFDPRLKWHCPPKHWTSGDSRLIVHPEDHTDFWQRTHYGFSADNGHFLHCEVAGNFVVSTAVRSFPLHQYDQSGLMVRCSPTCWLKTSVEFEPDGPCRLGVVITRDGFSDWSTQDFPAGEDTIQLRVQVKGQDVQVEFEAPGAGSITERARWSQIRLGHLPIPQGSAVQAGVYACSPKGAGFRAEFLHLTIESL